VPTARELLEQADALMRRNRAGADDDIPVLTDAVPSAQEAQSHFAPPLRPAEALPATAGAPDDLPQLAGKVEVIEVTALEPAVSEGEPSVWLEFQDPEPSVIGDAPDSIAIVPQVDLDRALPAPENGEIEDLDELDEELAAAVAAAPREEESLQPSAAMPPVEIPDEPPPETLPQAPSVIAGGAAALLHEEMSGPPIGAVPAVNVGGAAALLREEMSELPVGAEPAVIMGGARALLREEMSGSSIGALPVATVPTQAAVSQSASPLATADTAHWEAMAEEIRMQVLQRIDLFTDTGLRTQLGERLQPIVDRASADLVATINRHVGELLREYVAEAIEREIDSWRRNH
jgi:hypothetical protein